MWRRLLVGGPKQFGDLYYLGTAPVPDRVGLADVLVGTFGGVETPILRSIRATASCDSSKCSPDDDADPCEFYFTDYHELDGRMFPGEFEVRFGDGIYQVFACKQFQFKAAGEQ